jgi:phosphonate transport system substrate-binding protein
VVTGFADGAAVSSLVYERMIKNDPSLEKKIRIIMKSPEFAAPPIVANPRLDPVVRKRIQMCLLSMHESPEGRKILADLGIDRYEFPDNKLYDDIRTYASLWNPKP